MQTLRTCLILVFGGAAFAADPCVSGVAVGQRCGPYSFLVATGPERGKQTCFICEQMDKPTAVVFVRTLSNATGKLVAALDAEMTAHKDEGFKAWMTQLAPKADLDALAKWAQNQGLKNAPVGVFEDVDGPPSYKISAEADVTVMLFVNQKVSANYAFRAGELTDDKIKTVVKDTAALFKK
jgi:hypothetical protein